MKRTEAACCWIKNTELYWAQRQSGNVFKLDLSASVTCPTQTDSLSHTWFIGIRSPSLCHSTNWTGPTQKPVMFLKVLFPNPVHSQPQSTCKHLHSQALTHSLTLHTQNKCNRTGEQSNESRHNQRHLQKSFSLLSCGRRDSHTWDSRQTGHLLLLSNCFFFISSKRRHLVFLLPLCVLPPAYVCK